jgi:hypothetical protein
MWNPFHRETRVLRSSLGPEACRDRLRSETGSIWNPFSKWSNPVRGRVTDHGFWIVKTIHYRNSFQTVASGKWIPEGDGTRIELALGMNRMVAVFMLAWLAAIAAVGLTWWLSGAPAAVSHPATEPWFVGAIPILMLVFGVALIAFGRWLARNEATELIEFLSRTLECQPDATPIG